MTARLVWIARVRALPWDWRPCNCGFPFAAFWPITITESGKVLDHFVQCHLAEGLDRFDHGYFEMEFFVRRPLHSSFRSCELIDQLE